MTELKKRKEGWEAKDVLEYAGSMKLCIRTYKGSSGLVSYAAVNHYDGMGGYSHAYGLGSGGDYDERVIVSAQRGTEKNVAAQHGRAIAQLPAILERARAHYAKYPPRNN